MKHKLFVKNHCGPKNYTLIAFLMTLGLFNSAAQAMDPQRELSSKHPVVKRMDDDITRQHNQARGTASRTLDAETGCYMGAKHQVAEKISGSSRPMSSKECSLCTLLRDNILQHINPLIQENETLQKKMEELEKQVKSRAEKTEAPETQGKDER